MLRRLLRGLMVVVVMTTGVTVVTATAAAAAVGGCDNANPTVTACVNFGDAGNSARADFYFKKPPDSSYYTYNVVLNVNGISYYFPSGRLTYTGRYCCFLRGTDSQPDTNWVVYAKVYIYTSTGVYHTASTSPTIRYTH